MSQNNLPDKILIVDDDPSVAGAVKEPLSKYNIKLYSAHDVQTAMYHFNQHRFEVACVEIEFENHPGLIFLQKWRSHEVLDKRHCGFIMLSGNRGEHDAGQTRLINELRDVEILSKPFTVIQLLPILSRAKAARLRSLKLEEMRQTALKIGETEDKLEKALSLIQKQLPELGARGMEMMIELYEKHEKWDNALQLITPMIQKDSNNVGLINRKGRILLKMGRNQEALEYMEKADIAAPNHIDRINEMASAYLMHNQPDKAVVKMKQLLKFNPENPEMKFDMFNRLQQFGFDEHAQAMCKETTSPIEVVRYYNNKGIALKNTGNIDGALLEYDRSLKFYPKFKDNYRIHYNIALAQVGTKTKENYEIALESIKSCLELNPNFDKAKILKAQILKGLDQWNIKTKAE